MIYQAIRGDNYLNTYDLVCDTCGFKGEIQRTKSQCEQYAKIKKWKKLGANRHTCRKCQLAEWKTLKDR